MIPSLAAAVNGLHVQPCLYAIMISGCWSSVHSGALACVYVSPWEPGKMPLYWRQRLCSISSLAIHSSPTMHCNPKASNCQLRTEERARLKSTTLSTEEGRHNAAPLHRRREAIQKGEVKREKQKERMRLREAKREQEEQPTGPAFIPLTLPHPLPAFGPAVPQRSTGSRFKDS